MLILKGVTKIYDGQTAVDKVDLQVTEGEKFVLIGTSGSGKTTLLKMINKLIPKSAGTIQVDGQDIDSWDTVALRRRLGYVIQEVGLFPHYTIEQNVGLIPSILGWPKKKISLRVQELLDLVGIPVDLYKKKPDALSGGQQQRVGIARALAADPGIILMDEPFGALDPITRTSLQKEFSNLKDIENKTVVLVTHDMEEAAMLGDTICLMNQGTIQQTGPLNHLLFSPANTFVSQFFLNQRDHLEMKALRLRDLQPWLKTGENADRHKIVSADTTFHDAILMNQKIQFSFGGHGYIVDPEIIRMTYYQHRSSVVNQFR